MIYQPYCDIINTMNKLDEIKEKLNLLKANLMPSLRMPGPSIPKPKTPSMAASSKKNPIKVAEQIKSPEAMQFAMRSAIAQVKSQTNQLAFKSEDSNQKFHVLIDNQLVNQEPISQDEIKSKYKPEIETGRIQIVPIVQEQLSMSPSGQWRLKKV